MVFKTGYGALGEYTTVPADYIARRPPNVTPIEAAGITLTSVTAYRALFTSCELEAGQTVFINGGSTAVGIFAIQIAKAKGIRVVVSASARNEEFVRKLGADEVRLRLFEASVSDTHRGQISVHRLHEGRHREIPF